ncbi:MAG TPA: hypothetical protein DCS93_41680 [Microscillaceae bacterium]|nr:hypothetical protein [Microscillaceae bacterium]
MKYEEAKAKVLEFLNKGSASRLMVYEPAEEQPYGWVFYYDLIGVFHPRLEEVNHKLKNCIYQGKGDEECLKALTPEERDIYENGIGLVGNRPVFIDKDTGDIRFCSNFYLEMDMHQIREQKTSKKYYWKLYLKENLRKNKTKISEIRIWLSLSMQEIFQLINKANNQEPFLVTEAIGELIRYQRFLESLEVKYEVVEFEK